jgi:phosphate transport system substrate-binding protein
VEEPGRLCHLGRLPVGVGAKGNLGLTNTVKKTPGAISYISASYMIAAGLKAVAVQNRAKKFVYPNLANITSAALTVKSVPSSNTVSIVNPPASAKTAYPVSTFTYAVVPKSSSQKATIAQFITYAITKGQGFGASLDFPPLPAVVLAAAKKAVASL